MTRVWWVCPNEPPCPHPALFHDVEDYEDDTPTCCVDGCACGRCQAGRITGIVLTEPP